MHSILPVPRPSPLSDCRSAEWFRSAEHLETRDPIAARELLEECLTRVGGPSNAWRLLATLQVDAERAEDARRTLLRAVASYPNDAFAWAALARLEAKAGRGALALGAFERAHRIRPTHEGLALERSRALERFGSEVERLSARLAPLLAEADGRTELGDYAGALVTLDAAELSAGEEPSLLARIQLRRAMVHLGSGSADAGLVATEEGLATLGSGQNEPKLRAELLVVLSEVHLERGEPGLAERAAREAREFVPGHPVAAANLGLALLKLGQSEAAVDALIQAIEHGLNRRLDRRSFVGLNGIEALLESDDRFLERVEAAWSEEP